MKSSSISLPRYTKHSGVNHFFKKKKRKKPQKPQHTTSQIIVQYYNVLLCAKLTIYKIKYKRAGVSDTWPTDKNVTDLCMYNTHAAHDIFVTICLTLLL